jgi:hypothetical protein
MYMCVWSEGEKKEKKENKKDKKREGTGEGGIKPRV